MIMTTILQSILLIEKLGHMTLCYYFNVFLISDKKIRESLNLIGGNLDLAQTLQIVTKLCHYTYHLNLYWDLKT